MRLLRRLSLVVVALAAVFSSPSPARAERPDPNTCIGSASVTSTQATISWTCFGVPSGANHNSGPYTIVLTLDPPICDTPVDAGAITNVTGTTPQEGTIVNGLGAYEVRAPDVEFAFEFRVQRPNKTVGTHFAMARTFCPPGGAAQGLLADVG